MSNRDPVVMSPREVAVIGAGPAGLAAGAWLARQGFEPLLFEAADGLGGQWNATSPMSGVWPGMRTNTSRILTAFADLDHAPGTPVFPAQEEVLGYLHRYAAQAGLLPRIRFGTRVEHLSRAPGGQGWLLRSRGGGQERVEVFARVVVATGRYNAPQLPDIAGLGSFAGEAGVLHSFGYAGPAGYRDRSVVVAGCSISALEIASELALAGARRVTVTLRRQRYVLQKLTAGVPTDHVAFTRFAALAGTVMPPAAVAQGLRNLVVSSAGSPEQVGAPAPDADIFAAGLTQSQHYLGLVAEGRIRVRPWIAGVAGREVRFADGSAEAADGLILGTGYRLSLPFLAPEIAQALELDDRHIGLHDHTFHPELDGLAFLGLFDQVGPLFPVLELQARWLAYAWSGVVLQPSAAAMQAGLAACRARRGSPQAVPMHAMALLFARNAGVEPDPDRWPELCRALLFGPLSPASFRLVGPDRRADAAARTMTDAAAFGCLASPSMTDEEAARWEAVRADLCANAA
ncbi:FAD-dependent oxidoreductase [Belnapia sp. T6]|uniref:Trimethylamine monooxygenase n=1 Tax=Belnapia mucosa TaxID=2804532 RepID=A0ABS1V261_9PROT|nr:NAD(P)-binding domain-containing protein [Belnapia mucosa]MBL6455785.1 FAD-dependent oxidoreductase [Belnapia mucosa]